MADDSQLPVDSAFRHWLAGGITGISIIGVVVLAIAVSNGSPGAREVLSTVLPVIGTWVGTVLAFYFSKENLDSATRSVAAIAKQLTPDEKLRSQPVQTRMISRSQIAAVQRGPADQANLTKALEELKTAGKGDRIPVLDAQDVPLYVVHRSLVDKFLTDRALAGASSDDLKKLTLKDMLGVKELADVLNNSFDAVNENATLADAKAAMDAIDQCQDIFVTKGGTKKEPVLGWITNAIIEDNSKV